MKIENQVCTLEQAKKLNELGINQGLSLFQWVCVCPDPIGNEWYYTPVYQLQEDNAAKHGELLADAFTVAELEVMLEMDDDKHLLDYFYNGHSGCYEVVLNRRDERKVTGIKVVNIEEGDTEAEARVEMLIYLLEKNLTTAEEINARLKSD